MLVHLGKLGNLKIIYKKEKSFNIELLLLRNKEITIKTKMQTTKMKNKRRVKYLITVTMKEEIQDRE